jgi:hypothetical protein
MHVGPGDEIALPSIDCRCPIAAFYEDTLS